MELYLDSADVNEIKEAFQLGFLNGLTTTPTFMHRHGITDIDGTILELSRIVPVLQIEALGSTAARLRAPGESRFQHASPHAAPDRGTPSDVAARTGHAGGVEGSSRGDRRVATRDLLARQYGSDGRQGR